jgi:hypothetical protein
VEASTPSPSPTHLVVEVVEEAAHGQQLVEALGTHRVGGSLQQIRGGQQQGGGRRALGER